MAIDTLPQFIRENYEVHEWRHATAILSQDFPAEWQDILDCLAEFRLYEPEIVAPGGGKSPIAIRIDNFLRNKGWVARRFQTRRIIDSAEFERHTHAIDSFKNRVGIELEWNNKDPFFDRDLDNFRMLFEFGVVNVGVIVTRCDELQTIFDNLGKGRSYGASTTHMGKLLPKIEGGGGGGCPLLVFGIAKALYVPGGGPWHRPVRSRAQRSRSSA